ncbi:MAG TPA: ABC transporter permease [Firmicutes bacterium]|nr:ABC transporter permease [Bacillota bacterium]
MKWSNIFKVFRWEFIKNIKSPVFLITTLAMPLIMLVGGGLSYLASSSAIDSALEEEQQVAVIDESGEFFAYLEPYLADSPVKLTLHDSAERGQLREQIREGEIDGYLLFTEINIQSGEIDYYVQSAREMNAMVLEGAVSAALSSYRMEKIGLNAAEIAVATAPASLHTRSISGEEVSIAGMIAPLIFAMLLVVAVMVSGQVLMFGVLREKRNRIVEILLSSVNAIDLLLGKIIGFGLLGLLQIGIWLAAGLLVATRFYDLGRLGISLNVLLPSILFFVGGYVMFAALFAAMGATMKDAEGGSQTQGIVVMIPMIPLFASGAIMMAPNATWVRVFSYIPIFTPVTMLMRIGATSVPWWEIASTFTALLLGVAFFVYLGARIFSRGLLQFDRSISLREIGRMMRRSY